MIHIITCYCDHQFIRNWRGNDTFWKGEDDKISKIHNNIKSTLAYSLITRVLFKLENRTWVLSKEEKLEFLLIYRYKKMSVFPSNPQKMKWKQWPSSRKISWKFLRRNVTCIIENFNFEAELLRNNGSLGLGGQKGA